MQSTSVTELLATSRHIPEIIDTFGDGRLVEIRANSHDVRAFVKGHIDSPPNIVQRRVDLQEEIKTVITHFYFFSARTLIQESITSLDEMTIYNGFT
jgi:hypothetical protein